MEIARAEFAVVEKIVDENVTTHLRELLDLELVMVGGGQGDITLG